MLMGTLGCLCIYLRIKLSIRQKKPSALKDMSLEDINTVHC